MLNALSKSREIFNNKGRKETEGTGAFMTLRATIMHDSKTGGEFLPGMDAE